MMKPLLLAALFLPVTLFGGEQNSRILRPDLLPAKLSGAIAKGQFVPITVNGDVISRAQIADLATGMEATVRRGHAENPLLEKNVEAIRLQMVENLIEAQLIAQEFRKLNRPIAYDAIKERAKVLSSIKFQGVDLAIFPESAEFHWRKAAEDSLIADAILTSQGQAEPTISTEAIAAFYQAHKNVWTTHSQVKLQLIKVAKGADPMGKREAIHQLWRNVVNGADFAEYAAAHSEDATKNKGGDWGWVKPGELAPELERVAFALAKGGVSDIVDFQDAYYILRADDCLVSGAKTLEQMRDRIVQRLLTDGREKQMAEWLRTARKKAVIEY